MGVPRPIIWQTAIFPTPAGKLTKYLALSGLWGGFKAAPIGGLVGKRLRRTPEKKFPLSALPYQLIAVGGPRRIFTLVANREIANQPAKISHLGGRRTKGFAVSSKLFAQVQPCLRFAPWQWADSAV